MYNTPRGLSMTSTTLNTSRSLFSPARMASAALAVALVGGVALSAWAQGGPGMGGPGHGPMAMGMHGGGGGGPGHGPMMGMRGGDGPGMGMMAGRGMERMLDSVNATAEQRTQIKAIADKARAEMLAQREAGRGLREQMAKLFAQPVVDANAIEALRAQMLQQHDAQSRRMTQAMVEASRVLTPEQRKQIAERMTQRRALMERHRAERQALESNKPAPR
jgi:Spy/CpxP family protein refolding chaperone